MQRQREFCFCWKLVGCLCSLTGYVRWLCLWQWFSWEAGTCSIGVPEHVTERVFTTHFLDTFDKQLLPLLTIPTLPYSPSYSRRSRRNSHRNKRTAAYIPKPLNKLKWPLLGQPQYTTNAAGGAAKTTLAAVPPPTKASPVSATFVMEIKTAAGTAVWPVLWSSSHCLCVWRVAAAMWWSQCWRWWRDQSINWRYAYLLLSWFEWLWLCARVWDVEVGTCVQRYDTYTLLISGCSIWVGAIPIMRTKTYFLVYCTYWDG